MNARVAVERGLLAVEGDSRQMDEIFAVFSAATDPGVSMAMTPSRDRSSNSR
jgi:hypothetical protein